MAKKIPIVEKYYPSGKLYSITMYELKDKETYNKNGEIEGYHPSISSY